MSAPPIPGLCAVCVYRTTEFEHLGIKEPTGSPDGPGWRTVTGPELHTILHAWSRTGADFYLEGARVTHASIPSGEERLPMLPVVVVDGVGVCATHVGCLLPGKAASPPDLGAYLAFIHREDTP